MFTYIFTYIHMYSYVKHVTIIIKEQIVNSGRRGHERNWKEREMHEY